MPKNRPTIGQTNWGTPLNDHINQLSPNGGGINFSATPVTGLGSGDDGYTYVNTTTREIQRWNGTGWDVLLGGVAIGRETLTANRTYYVNNISGNDTNNGLTAGTAFATLAYAVDFVRFRLDTQDFVVTIQLADSATAYAGFGRVDCESTITIQGNTASPGNVVIDGGLNLDTNSRSCIYLQNFTKLIILQGLKFINTNNTLPPEQNYVSMVAAYSGSVMQIKNCEFGTSATSGNTHQIDCAVGGSLVITGPIIISGGGRAHIISQASGNVAITTGAQATAVGSVNFSAFVISYSLAQIRVPVPASMPATYLLSGTVTGSRFSVGELSICNTSKGINYFPGNVAGSADSSSFYS